MEAITVPKLANTNAIKNIKTKPKIKDVNLVILKPKSKETRKTKKPWKEEVVAPPKILPKIILYLDTGATKVSLIKPNCLSQIKSIPEKLR